MIHILRIGVYTDFLYPSKWRSETRLRTRAMPHIKSYARVSSDMTRASWFVLTSSNLSKVFSNLFTISRTTHLIIFFRLLGECVLTKVLL